jgi:6,7-dimethyl-8-ribityllumazine synthase
VPGCFEIPVVAEALARRGAAAIVGLGVVIRGDTPHFEYVCDAVTRGLTDVARGNRVAVGFGILTCDDEAQALARAGLAGSGESKGAEATQAAIATARILEKIS